MKRFVLITSLFIAHLCYGQQETNRWHFGFNAGIDFNSGSPVSFSGSLCSTSEGSASISDTSGNILFYTDGITVWNANNNQMPNGYGLDGGYSSTQSALIVPMPGSDSLYYIFTTGEQLSFGLAYSIVDMSLQSGLGDVSVKNVVLDFQSCEKITAVCHDNGTDVWVIAHDWDNNTFQAYLLSSSGVNTIPVTSSIGSTMNGGSDNTIGYMKGSPDGSRLALAVWGNNYFEVFDFDKSTGEVSHSILLQSYNGASSGAYGVEFSPDGSKLYGSVITPGYIYQWNMNAGTDSAIKASKTLVGTSNVNFNGALQLASDGKIYMAEYGSVWLGVINYPDTLGTDCDYVDQGFQLSYGSNGIGLPNIYPCFFHEENTPIASLAASTTQLCEKFCIDFFDQSINNPSSWQWIFEGASPSASTAQNPTNICYDDPGVYDVTLIASNSGGNSDTLVLTDYITVFENPFAPAITQSGNILTSSSATTYQWLLNDDTISGATNQSYTITGSGLYTVEITNENGCKSQSSVQAFLVGINEIENPIASVFSNPSTSNLIIEFNSPPSGEYQFSILNVLGQQELFAATNLYNQNSYSIDISPLSSGMYFLLLKNGGQQCAIKWIKQ